MEGRETERARIQNRRSSVPKSGWEELTSGVGKANGRHR